MEIEDELKAYLELPQLKCKTEQEAIDWWVEKTKRFPNLSAMARQYLGCPATQGTASAASPFATHDEEGGCGRKRAKTRVGVCRVFRIELCCALCSCVGGARLSPATRHSCLREFLQPALLENCVPA